MRKIPTVFVRNPDDRRFVSREITPGCEWVFTDPPVAVPTRKYDGTCCMLDDDGRWWARREVRPGKSTPTNFQLVQTDHVTGKLVGWEPIEQSGFVKFHTEAVDCSFINGPGTYELVGPRINGNPERQDMHVLVRHAEAQQLAEVPQDFDGLWAWLYRHPYEGIVWHGPDGKMAKLKAKDFPPMAVAALAAAAALSKPSFEEATNGPGGTVTDSCDGASTCRPREGGGV